MAKWTFAAPHSPQPDRNDWKEIRIYHDHGPIEKPGGFFVEFDWFNHIDTYEEDIFTLLRLNRLPDIHKYVMHRFRAWSPQFIAVVLTRTIVATDLMYNEGDVLLRNNIILEWISNYH